MSGLAVCRAKVVPEQAPRVEYEWPMVRLSDGLVTNLQTGFACGQHNRDGAGIIHLRPMNVTSQGEIELTNVKFVARAEAIRDERLVRAGDVIFNNTNSPELVGKTALYSSDEPRAFSNHMTRIRVDTEKVRPHFLALALHQLWREGYFADKCNNHVSQASISRAVLMETEIPLPQLSTQDSLLTLVAAQQLKLSSVQERLVGLPILLRRFRQSILAAAFSGQLTADWREHHPGANPPSAAIERFSTERKKRKGTTTGPTNCEDLPTIPVSWSYARLPDLGEVNRGKSKHRPRNSAHLLGGPYPLIQTGDVARSGGTIEGYTQTYTEAGLSQSRLWPKGTLCITIAANIAETGILAMPACFPDSIVGFIAEPTICNVRYVELFMRTAKSDLSAFAPATSQANINLAILEEVWVPLPSIDEQVEIARRVELLLALADSVEYRVADADAQVERITRAILAKAFRGELFACAD